MWDKLDGHLHWLCNVNECFPYLYADPRVDLVEGTDLMGTIQDPITTVMIVKIRFRDGVSDVLRDIGVRSNWHEWP